MRILFWVTSMNGEILALLRRLIRDGDHEILVAHDGWKAFESEPHQRLIPIDPPRVIPRTSPSSLLEAQRFGADVVVVDNVLPPIPVAHAVFVVWHGFAGKWMVQKEFDGYALKLMRLVGAVDRPNPRFAWKAYGPVDARRRALLGVHPGNLPQLGMAAADDVRLATGTITKKDAQPYYDIDLSRVILLAPTWHYGGVFSHWTDEGRGFAELASFARERGASLLVRMHDRRRYPRGFLDELEKMARSLGNVQLRFKDEGEDNLVDMAVSDVMITNYSSIGVLYYVTGRPILHIMPFSGEGEWVTWRRFDGRAARVLGRARRDELFIVPLERTGGPIARSMDEMFAHLEEMLARPEAYRHGDFAYLDEYIPLWRGDNTGKAKSFMEERFHAHHRGWPAVDYLMDRDILADWLRRLAQLTGFSKGDRAP